MINLDPSAQLILQVVAVTYLLILFGLSFLAQRKVHSSEDFLVAGRRLGFILCWGSLFSTWFAAETLMGTAQAARDEGIRGTILDPWACGCALILAGLFIAKPLWEMKLLTSGDFFRIKYGPKAEIVVCLIQGFSYIGWIAAQFIALAQIQEYYFGIPFITGIVIACTLTMCYTMIGGMWSVSITDTVQMVIAMIGMLFMVDAVFSEFGGSIAGGISKLFSDLNPDRLTLLPKEGIGPGLAWTGVLAVGLLGNQPGQELQQKIFSARSPGVARWSCIAAGIAYLLFGLIPIGLGLVCGLQFPGETNKDALMLMADHYLSPVMVIIFVISFISIVLSTATSAVLAAATILGHNLLGRVSLFRKRDLVTERICVALVALGSLAMAFSGDTILALLEFSLAISLVAVFVPFVAGLWGKPRGQLSAILAALVGLGYFAMRQISEIIVVGDGDVGYAEIIRALAGPAQLGPGIGHAAYAMALVPAELYGLGGSVLGYLIGQWILRQNAAAPPQQTEVID